MSKSKTPEYKAFYDAKQRCHNPKHQRYADWGGRGIKVLFESFDEFLADIGPRPPGHSLDRIDNSKHYEPGNVRWATRSVQQHNKRASRRNTTGVLGVRRVKAEGLKAILWQAYTMLNGTFIQLYSGPSFEEACKARRAFEEKICG